MVVSMSNRHFFTRVVTTLGVRPKGPPNGLVVHNIEVASAHVDVSESDEENLDEHDSAADEDTGDELALERKEA